MYKSLLILVTIISVSLSGCANFNPRNNPKIENQNGKIEDIRTNQNGVMAELMKTRQDLSAQNSLLKEIQSGLVNINSAISRNENTGVQIIQGDGALIFIFALIVIAMFLFYYRNRAISSEKTNELMVREIARFNNQKLEANILSSAVEENKGKDVYQIIRERLENL
jgi:hypothetical protein